MRGSRSKIPSKKSRPYIYDVKFLALLGAPYIHDISRLRVKSKISTFATFHTWPPDDGLQMGPKHVKAW
jgi:hypothetical protein